ncbi:MAG TPA: chaperonin GroEL [Planctomycetota bacterium]
MSHSHLSLQDDARRAVLAGATKLVNAVRPTLGPRSKCVLIARKWGGPLVCNDGVTIAKEVKLEDPDEDLGARLLREAAVKTGDAVGDGTTTSTLIAHAIFAEGVRNIAAGASAIDLKRGVDRAHLAAVEALRALSRPCSTREEREHVATVSAHNEPAVGKLVAQAMDRVGSEGVVSLEESKGIDTSLDVVEGMQFDRGFESPYFVTNPERMEAVLDDPLILLLDGKLTRIVQIVPLLEQVLKSGRQLLVVAESIEGDALATLVVNKIRGHLACAAVKAPGYGDRRKAIMQDIAILTGGEFLAEELGRDLDKVSLEQTGRAQRVVIDKDTTTIVGGHGDKAAISARCQELRRAIEATTSDYDREKLQERLAKLSGGVAVIRVGAPTEAEMKNRKEAFEDAIAATKAAVAEGIVPGGGVALLRAANAVAACEQQCAGDERTGVRILRLALESPIRQIAANSGADAGVVCDRVRSLEGSMGFDAATGKFVDMLAAGIIDPTKVVRTALANAVSVAGVLLLAEATLTEVEEVEKEAPSPQP